MRAILVALLMWNGLSFGQVITNPGITGVLGTPTCSWTPIDSSGAGLTFSSVLSSCTIIGNRVFAEAQLIYPSTVNASTAVVGGLPRTAPNSGSVRGTCVTTTNATSARSFLLTANTASGTFFAAPLASALLNSDLSGSVVWLSCSYPAS